MTTTDTTRPRTSAEWSRWEEERRGIIRPPETTAAAEAASVVGALLRVAGSLLVLFFIVSVAWGSLRPASSTPAPVTPAYVADCDVINASLNDAAQAAADAPDAASEARAFGDGVDAAVQQQANGC